MLKCPYCFETLEKETTRCTHCRQFIVDDILRADFPSLDKKKCIFCGKKILQEARFCKHCRKWVDEVDQAASDLDLDDLDY